MEGDTEKKEDAGDSGGSLLVDPGRKYGTIHQKSAVAHSLTFLLIFTFAVTLCLA